MTGTELHTQRLELHLSAHTFAQALGYTPECIQRWERFRDKALPRKAAILARLFFANPPSDLPVSRRYTTQENRRKAHALAAAGHSLREIAETLDIQWHQAYRLVKEEGH